MLLGWKWLGLWERLTGGAFLLARRLFGRCRLDLLVLLVLPLARIDLLVVVVRGCSLLGRLFGRRGLLLLLVALLSPRLELLLIVVRGRNLPGGLFSRCSFLLLVALLPARFELLLIVVRRRGLLVSRSGFDLLLVALLPARFELLLIVVRRCGLLVSRSGFDLLLPLLPSLISLLLFAGRRELFGRRGFTLFLLLALVPARLLLGLARLFGGRRFGLFLPVAPLAGLLFRLRLSALSASFGRFALGTIRLRRDKHCAVPGGAECSIALQRERA
ncbi:MULTISPECIES: hypothetical protein [unclassified Mesorhizobium]|uniref:hypothetical protein n=1 Tax=unclassified Mesorhizobium TaxID=325217 RepID=UPI00333DE1B5